MKISIVLGTRPEIIKFSPIIRECERLVLDYFVLQRARFKDGLKRVHEWFVENWENIRKSADFG